MMTFDLLMGVVGDCTGEDVGGGCLGRLGGGGGDRGRGIERLIGGGENTPEADL